MIILNSVSKTVGTGELKRTVLEDVTWQIPPRTRVVILGQAHSGASELLEIIGGMAIPTMGWIERRATVSVPYGLLRYANRNTTRQLIQRLSHLYRTNVDDVTAFTTEGMGRSDVLDVSPRSLPRRMRQQLNVILVYAFPCDFYLFSNIPGAPGEPKIQAFYDRALELRSQQAGIIFRTGSGRAARRLDPTMMGAVVHNGKFTLYRRLGDAIAVFESLPPEETYELTESPAEDQESFDDEDMLL
ncbi:MAG: hypothetical protein KIS73_25050 [Enhydrobacter sp.]|nr:hypothetical protein [Enhydrobacter sp.]